MADEKTFREIIMNTRIGRMVEIGLLSGKSVKGRILNKGADYFEIDPKKGDDFIYVPLSAIATFSVAGG